MYYLLFALYLLFFCVIINRIPFIKNAGLEKRLVILLFILKVAAGIVIGWMSATYYPQGNDYWNMNSHAAEEYQLLTHDPKEFFTNIFHSPYGNYSGFFNSVGSYWKDLANNIIIKFFAICDLVSRGNYYINSLFFNFLAFFGHVALYRVFRHIYPQHKWAVIIGCFLLPSTLYFTSGLHKDGVVFTMTSLFCYGFYFSLRDKFTTGRIILMAVAVLSILLLRNYVVAAIIPAAIAMYLAHKNGHALKSFALVYLSCIVVIIALSMASINKPLQIIVQKQKDFLDLPVATSQIAMDTLQPSISSFAKSTPRAMEHGLLRPYVWESRSFLIIMAIELLIYVLLFFYMLAMPAYKTSYKPFIYFGIFFALSLLLFAGYIVPNTGSLVRYRSLYLPFLVIPMLCRIWKPDIK